MRSRSSRGLKGWSGNHPREFEAEHAVNLGGLGREHDDGDFGGGRLEAAASCKSQSRSFPAASHRARSGPAFATAPFSALPRPSRRHHSIAGLLEVELHQFNRLRLVIHTKFAVSPLIAYHAQQSSHNFDSVTTL